AHLLRRARSLSRRRSHWTHRWDGDDEVRRLAAADRRILEAVRHRPANLIDERSEALKQGRSNHGIDDENASSDGQDQHQSPDRRLLDSDHAVLFADRLYRLRAAASAAGGGDVHPPWLSRLLPGGALVG